MKIDKLREKYNTAKAKAAERAAEIKRKETNLAELKAEQERAAAAGDLENYELFADKIRRAEMELFVYIKSTQISEIITPEDAANAWKEYADKNGGEVMRLYREYEKSRGQLVQKYQAAVLKQNEVLRARADLAEMTGTPASVYVLKEALPDSSEHFPKNAQIKAPEFAFFVASGEWKGKPNATAEYAALDTLNSVVRLQQPLENPAFN